MQAITALAHLRAAVLYFMDLSEQCGHTLHQQKELFDNVKPLFSNKPLIVCANKIDVKRREELADDDKVNVDTPSYFVPVTESIQVAL